MQAIERPEDRFLSAFEAHHGRALNGSGAHVHALRREAIGRVEALGFPTRKSEAWKYTDITAQLRADWPLGPGAEAPRPSPEALAAARIPGLDAYEVVLVNGRCLSGAPEGLPEGFVVGGLADCAAAHPALFERHFGRYADHRGEVFTALNTAFTHDGVCIYAPRGAALDKPVHIISLLQAEGLLLVQPRYLVVAEDGASVEIIETQTALGEPECFTNSVAEVYGGRDAQVSFYRIQDEGRRATQVAGMQVYQETGSNCTTFTATLSGRIVRNNLSFLPADEHCESHLFGLFIGGGDLHVDNHTHVEHARPNCVSNELYKGILDDHATGVFNGKVFVRQDAQKTNAYQSNKSIILTPTARMYSKPELEIYADDVKCSHGATTGQLDPEALFYLQSRGIPAVKARAMLLLAFARDVLENVRIAPLRDMLDHAVETRYHD